MNHLAHCVLAHLATNDESTRPDLIAGGFAADFSKGPVAADLPVAVKLGIRLHRRIDAYSGEHEHCRDSARRFPDNLRRPAPIFVDVVADYCLINAWSNYTSIPLETFTNACYGCIDNQRQFLPDRGRRFLDHAAGTDLFARYGQWPVIERTLESILDRLGGRYASDAVLQACRALSAELSDDFAIYFPDMVTHARSWVAQMESIVDAG